VLAITLFANLSFIRNLSWKSQRPGYIFLPLMKWFERPPRILLALVLLWAVLFLWLFSDAGVPFPSWVAMSLASIALGLAWTVRLAIAYANQTQERRLISPQLRYWVAIPTTLVAA
jgi:hypothetical protein